jgi:hypothetical protein
MMESMMPRWNDKAKQQNIATHGDKTEARVVVKARLYGILGKVDGLLISCLDCLNCINLTADIINKISGENKYDKFRDCFA